MSIPIDEIPTKLIDCPELAVSWPQHWRKLGMAARLDYSTGIHDGDMPTPYTHAFDTGVDCYIVDVIGDSDVELEQAEAPIRFAVADRLFVNTDDDTSILMARIGAEVESSSLDVTRTWMAFAMPLMHLAWDVENSRVLLVASDGTVTCVLCGGLLELREDAMILG